MSRVILVVDDNPENLRVLSGILKPQGYKVRVAMNGVQALKSVHGSHPDLVLLDVQMPEKDGYAVCKELKANPETEGIPVIFVSALSDTPDKVRGFEAGGVDFIEKPFQAEEVLVRVHTQLTLREQQLSLEKALSELREAQLQLVQQEKMAAVGQLTAGLAHEMNNPINYISVGAQALKTNWQDVSEVIDALTKFLENHSSDPDYGSVKSLMEEVDFEDIKSDVEDTIRDIDHGTKRTTEVVTGLRNFSRMDTTEPVAFDLEPCIEDTLSILRHKMKEGITIERDFDSTLPRVTGHPGQVNQVIMNLLSNAIDAVTGSGTIRCSTSHTSEDIVLTIADDGVGMDEETLSKATDPFFTTKEVGEGTGLGLSISYGIIESHHGSLTFSSELGKGTTAEVRFPVNHNLNSDEH